MSRNGEVGNERSKAAAWVWYQRGASSSRAQQSGDLLKRRRRSSSSRNEAEEIMAIKGIMAQPSRFKREAAAAHYDHHYLQATPPSPAAPHDYQHVDHSYPAAGHVSTKHALANPTVRSSGRSPQRSPAACRNCHLSPTASGTQPAALGHCAQCGSRRSPALRRKSESALRRKSESSPPAGRDHWTDKLFGIRRRKSFSSLHSDADSLRRVCSTDLADSFPGPLNGDGATASTAAFPPPNCVSSLLDSFELHAILKKLGYEADDDDFEERTLRSLEKETRQLVLGNDHHDFSAPPAHCKQSLYDILGWSERGLNRKGCSCSIEEDDHSSDHHYYHVESPEINIGSCSSSGCSPNAAANVKQRRRHRRPSIFMPHLPHSFSNALHHMHMPHLPHSFSNALHHLPHSFSNALHHLPHLRPHSFSNALHRISHSLSSAYHHLHTASHHQNANDGAAHSFHTNDATPNSHHIDVAASPHHHAQTHRHLIPAHLRHLLSFKAHHSRPPHPSCAPTVDSVSQTVNCHINPTPALVQHSLKSFPSFNQHLSKSDDYMLIYSSAKRHSSHGSLHHHHHHHYHHYHYVA